MTTTLIHRLAALDAERDRVRQALAEAQWRGFKERTMALSAEHPYEGATDRATALQDAIDACEGEIIAEPTTFDDKTYNAAIAQCVQAIKALN